MAKRLGIAAPDPVIVGLRYLSEGEENDLWGPSYPEATELRNKSLQMLLQDDRNLAALVALDFVVRRAE
jgi:hypothetical protein